ncbi:hypothetical protein H6F88_31530 [Oculatella sp. FACHB-28]|uniref:hypothetical protein n=1 Tax=Oculatella sp. FACHB-28 TaxID=2692845 RepID=UPI001684DB2F|nr:hypothetical protein [Oculatella sp. FACHB-28]MBD2060476.1 hypothetical protein [Oculatella sp. FACHB-28]
MPTPKFSPEDILECARSIRPSLPSLLGSDATQVDQQLADLLAQAQAGESVDTQILELLKSNPNTFQWIKEFLSSAQVSRGFERLPGGSGAVPAQKYVCPQGDYVWYRRSVGISVPTCPTHGELIPDQGA